MINKFLNYCWFLLNYKRYLAFKNRIVSEGRKETDIWYSRKIGFICF